MVLQLVLAAGAVVVAAELLLQEDDQGNKFGILLHYHSHLKVLGISSRPGTGWRQSLLLHLLGLLYAPIRIWPICLCHLHIFIIPLPPMLSLNH